jgi:SAM-dependent methyltransferase
MTQHWRATSDSLQIDAMPFYWRLSESSSAFPSIAQHLPIRVTADERFDYLKFEPAVNEWAVIDAAYRQNENIGFLNPESGQMATYGASANNFFLMAIRQVKPTQIFEIGCGAGYSIHFLQEQGFKVTGIDPSEYSLRWSERLGFNLINDFFREGLLDKKPDFIYCNDVFEHVRDVAHFSRAVYDSLDDEGVFCIATTNSTRSIALGDISMFEHQHVNMFTDRSLRLILREAGFSDVDVGGGAYGNTFHVIARKSKQVNREAAAEGILDCAGYFHKASKKIESFGRYYAAEDPLHCYVPLRCIPYLATVGDYGWTPIYDSNAAWRGKFIDGYGVSIRGLEDIAPTGSERFFVGSITFYEEIRRTLLARGYPSASVSSIESLS